MDNTERAAQKSANPRRTLVVWSASALLLLGSTQIMAQDQSGWERLGGMLAGGNRVDSERAYLEGLKIGAETRASIEQAKTLNYENMIRSSLSRWWSAFGFPPADAHVIAAAYELTASEPAVVAEVRNRGTQASLGTIRNALDGSNYLLANQLLLAYIVVSGEEQQRLSEMASDEEEPRAEPKVRAELEHGQAASDEDAERRRAQRQTELETSTLTAQQRRELALDK